jgi:hypothetical protein
MRLLKLLPNGEFHMTEKFLDDRIPRYAILSHTWGGQEVIFEDVFKGLGEHKHKAGYEKVKFCGEQAAKDDIQYFWVDSCCIDKSSSAELQEAITSMFRWYQRAAKCYVYLSDVSIREKRKRDESLRNTWERALRESKWFTRGWTLQELLAPTYVEFFSKEGSRLGDKQSLEQEIQEITGIPISALRGSVLSHFSAEQKFNWAKHRKTTREEDWVYSLLGVFGISIPVMYGEGRENAVRRLRNEIDNASKDQECLRHLYVTDPDADKIRIEETKGGLIVDSYHWVLENHDFIQWINNQQNHLLWIKGDPGKGKTMLLCGIIDELKKSTAETHLLSYFFCQATDSRINNSTAVLRGLLYVLIKQQPSLISHLRKQHNYAGKNLFDDANAWVALAEIFTNVLQDPSLKTTYLIIDALDECTIGCSKLVAFISEKSSVFPRVKWLVSSRNWPSIEERLDKAGRKVRLCLELNAESISAAVRSYIRYQVHRLAQEKKYDNSTREVVVDYLSANAKDTFLWVALVCQNLEKISRGRVRARLNSFLPGLDSFYDRMMKQICESEDSQLYKQILALVASVYKPITLAELASLIDMLEDISEDVESLKEIVGLCGSFLTIREGIIYFVHQSAKDYLYGTACVEIFPYGNQKAHNKIFSRSLKIMSRTLQQDICSLRNPGISIDQVKSLNLDPLDSVRYSCLYWVDHLLESNNNTGGIASVDLEDGGSVHKFLCQKFLYWLEALSLIESLSSGIVIIRKLENRLQVSINYYI